MNQVWGADVDALDDLGRHFAQSALTVDAVMRRLNARLAHVPWQGAEADRFRADWSRRHRPQLASVTAFLRSGSDQLQRQAEQQRQASSAGGGSTGFAAGFAAAAAASTGGGERARLQAPADQAAVDAALKRWAIVERMAKQFPATADALRAMIQSWGSTPPSVGQLNRVSTLMEMLTLANLQRSSVRNALELADTSFDEALGHVVGMVPGPDADAANKYVKIAIEESIGGALGMAESAGVDAATSLQDLSGLERIYTQRADAFLLAALNGADVASAASVQDAIGANGTLFDKGQSLSSMYAASGQLVWATGDGSALDTALRGGAHLVPAVGAALDGAELAGNAAGVVVKTGLGVAAVDLALNQSLANLQATAKAQGL